MLSRNASYDREDVYNIFVPASTFTPRAGPWGAHGIVRIPDRPGDFVFFVTFGSEQAGHVFDEKITEDGVLFWQSQPSQNLETPTIKELIAHDETTNSIYLFLREKKRQPYRFIGKLKYLDHDQESGNPVYFKWQVIPENKLHEQYRIKELSSPSGGSLQLIDHTPRSRSRTGSKSSAFRASESPDYLELDRKNSEIGLIGELLVLKTEKERLQGINRDDLARSVSHISQTEGDGAGYDILSFSETGEPLHIEVKTTRGGPDTEFFMSPNEVMFSKSHSNTFRLYRVFDLDEQTHEAKMFILSGDMTEYFELVPTNYRLTAK